MAGFIIASLLLLFSLSYADCTPVPQHHHGNASSVSVTAVEKEHPINKSLQAVASSHVFPVQSEVCIYQSIKYHVNHELIFTVIRLSLYFAFFYTISAGNQDHLGQLHSQTTSTFYHFSPFYTSATTQPVEPWIAFGSFGQGSYSPSARWLRRFCNSLNKLPGGLYHPCEKRGEASAGTWRLPVEKNIKRKASQMSLFCICLPLIHTRHATEHLQRFHLFLFLSGY